MFVKSGSGRHPAVRRVRKSAPAGRRVAGGGAAVPPLVGLDALRRADSRASLRGGRHGGSGSGSESGSGAHVSRRSLHSVASFSVGSARLIAEAGSHNATVRDVENEADRVAAEEEAERQRRTEGQDRDRHGEEGDGTGGGGGGVDGGGPEVDAAEAARREAEKQRREEESALWLEAAQYSLMGGDTSLLTVAAEKVVHVTRNDDLNAAAMSVLRQADSKKVQRAVLQVRCLAAACGVLVCG